MSASLADSAARLPAWRIESGQAGSLTSEALAKHSGTASHLFI